MQTSFIINGVGSMGKGLAHQISNTPEIECVGLCDIDVRRAVDCATWLGLDYKIVDSPSDANSAIAAGKVAISENGAVLTECQFGDIFIEASSAITDAARLVISALSHGKNIVMMNSEADLAFGPLLASIAASNGLLYSSADGDQYGVLMKLAEESSAWGFDLVMFGNIKGFLDRRANPTSIIAQADLRNLDYTMCAAFTDGTKLNVEMALIANVYGAQPLRTGMNGPRVSNVGDVLNAFRFDDVWDGKRPLVDYILGANPGGGVFLVGHSADPYRQDMMRYYKMGDGPFYVFYRPYHLCHFEAVATATSMMKTRKPLMQARQFHTDVGTYAKTSLPAGTILDGVGGYTCYGLIEDCVVDGQRLPILISKGTRLTRAVAQDERITLEHVSFHDPEELNLFTKSRASAQLARSKQS